MKKMLAMATVALLLSVGAASANRTTITGILPCDMSIYKVSDSGHGVSANILLAVDVSPCGWHYFGSGVIGTVNIPTGDKKVYAILGYSSDSDLDPTGEINRYIAVVAYPFVTGGSFTIYRRDPTGTTVDFSGSGTYTVK